MTEPVRPLEALIEEKIAEWRERAAETRVAMKQFMYGGERDGEILDDDISANFEVAMAQDEAADELAALLQAAAQPAPTAEPKWIASGMTSYTADGEVTGYINPTAAPPERVSEGKDDELKAWAERNTDAVNAATLEAKYYELLYAVGNKHRGESRHETALRYIRQAETSSGPYTGCATARPAVEPREEPTHE